MTPFRRSPSPSRAAARGFSLLELIIAGSVIAVIGMAGVAYVARASQNADYARDRLFARQKALSILDEMKAYVEGSEDQVAADLDGFDDGILQLPVLTIAEDPKNPGQFVPADNKLSGNAMDLGEWKWYRKITVQHFPGIVTRDIRVVTVRVYRHRPKGPVPGDTLAQVSSVVRTIGTAYPTTQVYDVYLLALENIPGWWVYMDSIKPFVDSTLSDLEARNPGLEFRAHWITTAAYGRDELYAPYTNETRVSTDATPWTYVYPGKMPSGSAATRYYVPANMRARVNLDGQPTPVFVNDYSVGEAFVDANANGVYDAGETYTDANGNGQFDLGDAVPYALADQQNHAMRWPEENAKFNARVAAGLDVDDTPTWRLLLDRLIADPARYHNAIFVNLHGELLPMPAVRNYSDAARDPAGHGGWRCVAHPERLRPRRTQGSDPLSDAPRWRVYAYRTEFPTAESLMTLKEPFTDVNKNGVKDATEPFVDWNANAVWDDDVPITLDVPGIDCSGNPNGAVLPTLLVKRLSGGVDANGDGVTDNYVAFANATTYPEKFTDLNGDGIRNRAEPSFDRNGNGVYDAAEPFTDLDGNGVHGAVDEAFTDANGNTRFDLMAPADTYTDSNVNGKWDAKEPYFDINADGVRNPPTVAVLPWRAWNPAIDDLSVASRNAYAAAYGEPYADLNGNGAYNAAEPLLSDSSGNGVHDGGYARGEMWYDVAWDAVARSTVVHLHGTPMRALSTADNRGLGATARLYDLEYVPCPMINAANAANPPFERDLYNATANVPKNTARWTIEIPLAQVRKGFETGLGLNDGDATDRILEVRTRLGSDRSTGTMWPAKNHPENLSRAWSYFYSASGKIPFSERFQFQGDPRSCPYADLDRYGTTTSNGYNWYFDTFATSGNAQANWLAFDATRLAAGWNGANRWDTPRFFQWLRTAITKTEMVYTTLTGFSYYYLSLGGDVGYDTANGFPSSIPMNGTPHGNAAASVFEDTITTGGTAGIGGSQKYVRSNNGAAAGIRSGGYWWSKPWLGELYQDAAYAGQWSPWGNLRAATGAVALQYRLMRRGDTTPAQQPTGTLLSNGWARTSAEGCTSLFNIGTSASTFHHQYKDGQTGDLVSDGLQVAANYNFPVPVTAPISRPFSLATNVDGGLPTEFGFNTDYPKYSASAVTDFYNHQSGTRGSALVRLVEPGANPRAGFIVVNGIDRTTGSGSAFIARYSVLTLIHSFFASGVSGTGRVHQLPRLQVTSPTIITELNNPAAIAVTWKTEWKRWDGQPYTSSYASTFTEPETDLVYVLLYSLDSGKTWLNMMTDQVEVPGDIPWIAGVGPDTTRTVKDVGTGNESYSWSTPAAKFPEGSYIIRIDGYRTDEAQHYFHHQEKIFVNR